MDEALYIEGIRNEKEFRDVFEKFHTGLCYFANGILKGAAEAEDVVQDAFVKLWQKREDFQELQAIKGFLYLTVKNKCLNIYRHTKVVTKYEDLLRREVNEENIVLHAIEADVLDQVYKALQKLPVGCRNVLQLSYFERIKNKDIALQLRVSVNTVKTQKKRALHLLRNLLKAPLLWVWF